MKDNLGVKCNHRWTTKPPRKNQDAAYGCSYVNATGGKLCNSKQVAKEKMERLVLDAIPNYLRQPKVVHEMMREEQRGKNAESVERCGVLENRLAEIRHEQDTLDREVIKANLPDRTRRLANQRLQELQIEEMHAKAELRRLSVVMTLPSEDAMARCFQQKLDAMDRMKTFQEKDEFLDITQSRMETDGYCLAIHGTIAVPVPEESTGNGQKNWNRGGGAYPQPEDQHCQGRDPARPKQNPPREAKGLASTPKCNL